MPDIAGFTKLLDAHPDLCGLNVTIPLKRAVIQFLGKLSREAEAIGAVNTICFTTDGLVGHNTDWIGFRDALLPHLDKWHELPSALIFGMGGVGHAIADVLGHLAIPYQFVSRRQQEGALTYETLTDDLIAQSLLIVNATPLGMYPQVYRCPEMNYNILTPAHLLFDVIYNPEITEFLRRGKAHGAETENGLKMLRRQAEASWDLWNITWP